MIQRIQSIFLLLASGSLFGLFGLPFAKTEQALTGSVLFSDQTFNILDNEIMLALFCTAGTITFLSVLMFKNRSLQVRMVQFVLLLILGAIGWSIYQFSQDTTVSDRSLVQYGPGLVLPFLGFVFAALAIRFIKKDEKLVQSMDRLR